jgi:hypothetical protein
MFQKKCNFVLCLKCELTFQYDEKTVSQDLRQNALIEDIVDTAIGRYRDQTTNPGKLCEAKHLYTTSAYNVLKEVSFFKKS